MLKENICEHDSKIYRQQIGISMGLKQAPEYANILRAREIEPHLRSTAQKYTEGNIPLNILKRFLDDILTLFIGASKTYTSFLKK